MILTETSDDTLLRLATAGDEEAFTVLYRRRQTAIYRYALHMSGSAAVAEEVTQDVFLALLRDPKYDSGRGSLASYLYGIARNHVLRNLDRDRNYVALDDAPDTTLRAVTPCPLGDLTRTETIEQVRQAVLTLPANYREVIVLCDLEEICYAEAAGMLGVPVGTVRSRLSRGRALLVEKLRAVAGAEPRMEGFNSLRCFA